MLKKTKKLLDFTDIGVHQNLLKKTKSSSEYVS